MGDYKNLLIFEWFIKIQDKNKQKKIKQKIRILFFVKKIQ